MRWRVLGSYHPREQWLCTALMRGERRCIDWVRRKELFSANMHLMNIHYHTNLNNLRQLAGSSRASLHFSPHIWLLAEAVTGQCVPALRWAVRQRRPRSHGLFFFFFFNRWGWQTTVSGARFCAEMRQHLSLRTVPMLYELVEHHFVGAWTTDVIVQRNLEGW